MNEVASKKEICEKSPSKKCFVGSFSYSLKDYKSPITCTLTCEYDTEQELREKVALEVLKSLHSQGFLVFQSIFIEDENRSIDIIKNQNNENN